MRFKTEKSTGRTVQGFPSSRTLFFLMAIAMACAFWTSARAEAGPLTPVQNWTQKTTTNAPPARSSTNMVFDPSIGNVVLFGGQGVGGGLGDTWTWDGSNWTQMNPATAPPRRWGASMAFDPSTGDVVLFGGVGASSYLGDTWTWDGSDWTLQTPGDGPAPRRAAAMAFDPSIGKLVLFGGLSANGFQEIYHEDTWTWDGNEWTELDPAQSPSPRFGASMAFDPSIGKMIMFGGRSESGPLSDTWTWNPTGWTQLTPAHSPSTRVLGSLEFDPRSGDLILFGGGYQTANHNETWAWTGTDWEERSPAERPMGRYGAGMTFDPGSGSLVLFGGNGNVGGVNRNDTWTYGPPAGLKSNWAELRPANSPPFRYAASMAFDQSTSTMVMYGGWDLGGYAAGTWTWDGSDWTRETPATNLPPLTDASMAFDPSSGDVVLFGGAGPSHYQNETWTWDGSDWTLRTPVTSPQRRSGHSLAFDPSIGKLVMFGGRGPNGSNDDTWTWDGSNWTRQTPATNPPARDRASMAFDPSIGRMVMFGGRSDSGPLSDTWTWDGSDWTRQTPSTSPTPREGASFGFDPTTGKAILFGGYRGSSSLADTWTWDGADWTQQTPARSPSARDRANMAFDPTSGKLLLVAGRTPPLLPAETWTYSLEADAPAVEISSPSTGGSFRVGSTVPTSFTCTEGLGGPGLDSCVDSRGSASPGVLDTSTLGTRSYKVTATSRNGLESSAEISYEVLDKAQPTLVVSGSNSGRVGDPFRGELQLEDGASPRGTMYVAVYGPDDPECSGSPAAEWPDSPVDGNNTYATFFFRPGTVGDYRWMASYPGDANNKPAATVCGAPRSVATATPWLPILAADGAGSGQIGQTISFAARISAGHHPTGTVSFAAYGPGDPDCSGAPAFTSEITADGERAYDSTPFRPSASGTYRWTAAYSGDANNDPLSTTCGAAQSISTVSKAAPSLETTATSSIEISGAIRAEADLSDAFSPTGEITFYAYGSDDPECTGTPVFESEATVADDGIHHSTPFVAPASGDYRWIAAYSGDRNNEAATTTCGAEGSISSVSKATPNLTVDATASVVVGADIRAEMEMSGAFEPGGTITFTAYGPEDPECSASPAFESPEIPVDGEETHASPAFTPTSSGTYRWVVNYSGDRNNEAAATACGDENSISTVDMATPSLTTEATPSIELGGEIQADAELSGAFEPTGTIAFKAYGPDDPECSGAPAFRVEKAVNDERGYESSPFTAPAAGTYHWVVNYSGDLNNKAAETACGTDGSVSNVSKAAPILAVDATASIVLGADVRAETELSGAFEPGGTITYKVYGPEDPECSASPAFESPEIPVDGKDAHSSPVFKPTTSGAYRWVVSYSGDRNNEAVTTVCGADSSISMVEEPMPPPPPPPEPCPTLEAGLSLQNVRPSRPFGNSMKTPGILVRVKAGADVQARIIPEIRYRAGKLRTVKLRSRTIRINGSTLLRFRLPARVKRQIRKTSGRFYNRPVTLRIQARLKSTGTPVECFTKPEVSTLKTRIKSVSSRVALRILHAR